MRVSIKLLAAALFLVVTTVASAQMREQRIEHTIVSTQAPEANHIQPHLTSHRAGQSEMGHDPLLPFTVTLEADTLDVSDAQEHAFQGTITNISHDTITIFFKRYQSLPCGWITSVCFGANCFSTLTDSASYMIPPVDSAVHSIQLTVDVTAAAAETAANSLVHITIGAGDWASIDTVPLKLYSVYNPSNPPRIFSLGNLSNTNFNDTGLHIVTALLSNLACSSTHYKLSLADSLPPGWTLTRFSVGNSNANNGEVTSTFDGKGGGNDIQKVKVTMDVGALRHTDSAVFYLSVHPQTDNAADSALYRIVAIVHSYQVLGDTMFRDSAKSEHTVSQSFKNFSTDTTQYAFSLEQSLPSGWTYTLCIGDSCAENKSIQYVLNPEGASPITVTLHTPALTQPDSTKLSLRVIPSRNPIDWKRYPLNIFIFPSSASVTPSAAGLHSGFAVLNAWPNPLRASSNLHLDIMTDRGGAAFYEVYDMAGNELHRMPLGELFVGENHVLLDDLKLPSGDYVIRIEQSGGAFQSVRLSYVK